MYGDRITGSMKKAIEETNRRRKIQKLYNRTNNITPKTIQKEITATFLSAEAYANDAKTVDTISETLAEYSSSDDLDGIILSMENKMKLAAKNLDFEKAAEIRDKIDALKKRMVFEL